MTMKITKIAHSGLILEEGEKKLLIDPGTYCFRDTGYTPQQVAPVDAILLTHRHADHADPAAIKTILGISAAPVIANAEIAQVLAAEGIAVDVIRPGETRTVAGFKIEAFSATHELIPTLPIPTNLAYRINGTLVHPGDSFALPETLVGAPVFALPVAGPWAQINAVIECGKRMHARHVIPIHDAQLNAIGQELFYRLVREHVPSEFHPLQGLEKLEA